MEMPIDYGAIARQVIDDVDVDELLSNLQDYMDFAAKNIQCEMANNLQNAIMVIAAMRHELSKRDERWISVDDKIPNENSDEWCVGITNTGRCVAFIEKNAYENNNGGVNVPTYMMHGSEITHWMSLPEPPKKEDEQNG